jgi:hypothetical protein
MSGYGAATWPRSPHGHRLSAADCRPTARRVGSAGTPVAVGRRVHALAWSQTNQEVVHGPPPPFAAQDPLLNASVSQ